MKTRITNYIKAGYSCLYILSHEESRVEATMREVIDALNAKVGEEGEQFTLCAWSLTDGVINVSKGGKSIPDTQDPLAMLDTFINADERTVYLCRDFHLFVEDKNPMVWRKIRDALSTAKSKTKTLVVLGCRFACPPELEKEITVVDFSLPKREQIKAILDGLLESNGHGKAEDEAGILNAAAGLTTIEAENAFALSIIERGVVAKDIVYREKCQAVEKAGLLEVVKTKITLADVGGLDAAKAWLIERRDAFSDAAKAYGLPTPRGYLCVGQPGTGKSLMAKACRSVFDVPLLRLDASRLFGSLVGQSEANWRTVHATALAMAPCVMWIDEVDGAMSGGSSSGQTDGGTTARVIKSILQDMQENSEGIFYVLTANDVDNLPAPLLRRMDEVWNVELPTMAEREVIWGIQLRKVNRKAEKFDLKKLSDKAVDYSGAEIEKVVTQTLYSAFADGGREPTTEDALRIMEEFVPLARTMADDINKRRERLKGVAKLASGPTAVATTSKQIKRKLAAFAG